MSLDTVGAIRVFSCKVSLDELCEVCVPDSEAVSAANYPSKLGVLLNQLQSLECLLRAYLLAAAQRTGRRETGPDYWSLDTGDEVAVDEFTNYDSLGTLIRKFNNDVREHNPSLEIDRSVVEIRDLIAHGRVASRTEDCAAIKIVKFDEPRNGKVRVVASAVMDNAWFDAKCGLTQRQLSLAYQAYQKFSQ